MKMDPLVENVRTALACGAEPSMALAVALASLSAGTLQEAFDQLEAHREEILRLSLDPGSLKQLAPLEPELRYEPELAAFRLDIQDHELRGRLLYGDLLGQKSFFQVAALEIAGVDLSAEDAELLSDTAIATQLADPQIWPLTVTRRIAAGGGGLARSVIGGFVCLCTSKMAGLPVAGFMRFLTRVDEQERSGRQLAEILDEILGKGEHIPGVGRPVFGVDERVPQMLALYSRRGRDRGRFVQLALRVDKYLHQKKGIFMNSAGLHGALLHDLGFSPDAAAAMSQMYFLLPVLAHAVYAAERVGGSGAAE